MSSPSPSPTDTKGQVELLLKNIREIVDELDNLVKKAGLSGLNELPCDFSRFMTRQLCSLTAPSSLPKQQGGKKKIQKHRIKSHGKKKK